jgi:hypothetical protein
MLIGWGRYFNQSPDTLQTPVKYYAIAFTLYIHRMPRNEMTKTEPFLVEK